MQIGNPRGPWPQRGFSWVGAEQTSKLRRENLMGESWDELKDFRVRKASPLALDDRE
jgi:hypothetical protein